MQNAVKLKFMNNEGHMLKDSNKIVPFIPGFWLSNYFMSPLISNFALYIDYICLFTFYNAK